MDDIDVSRLQEKLEETRLKRTLKQAKSVISLCAATAAIPPLILSDSSIVCASSIGVLAFAGLNIKKCYNNQIEQEKEEIASTLRSTETYKKCKREYEKYITEVAKLVRTIGIDNAQDTLIYLSRLLNQGQLSKSMTHRHRRLKYENEYLQELSGAKVSTGVSKAINSASLITDILNKLGYTAAVVEATLTKRDPKILARDKYIIWDHALTAVVDGDKTILFDTTKGAFAVPCNKKVKSKDNRVIRKLVGGKKQEYAIIKPARLELNPKYPNNVDLVNAAPTYTITPMTLDIAKRELSNLHSDEYYTENRFYMDQEQRRAKIEETYNKLCPSGDEPIKKWRLK